MLVEDYSNSDMVRNKPVILKSSDLFNKRDNQEKVTRIAYLEEHNLAHELQIKELLLKVWEFENVPKQDMAQQTWILLKAAEMQTDLKTGERHTQVELVTAEVKSQTFVEDATISCQTDLDTYDESCQTYK